jgi:hypothetical protein
MLKITYLLQLMPFFANFYKSSWFSGFLVAIVKCRVTIFEESLKSTKKRGQGGLSLQAADRHRH